MILGLAEYISANFVPIEGMTTIINIVMLG